MASTAKSTKSIEVKASVKITHRLNKAPSQWWEHKCVEWGHGDSKRTKLTYQTVCWGLVRKHCNFSAEVWPGSCCWSYSLAAAVGLVAWRQLVFGWTWSKRNGDESSSWFPNRLEWLPWGKANTCLPIAIPRHDFDGFHFPTLSLAFWSFFVCLRQ